MQQAHIEQALNDHFLFRKLTESQCHVLLDCMQRVNVEPGDIIVKQVSFLVEDWKIVVSFSFCGFFLAEY